MCDTLVALHGATANNAVIFAKNSDRHPNEAHEVVIVEAADHAPGATVRCSYIDIPQVRRTHRVLLCKPFWIWGAEMGLNEHGVAIGNEATFSRMPYNKGPGLCGLDLVRLGLERSASADEALEVLPDLGENETLGGNGGYGYDLFCDHSFIVADSKSAWVLETAGRHWAAEKVTSTRAISNRHSIRGQGDRISSDLVSTAIREGWCKSEAEFDVAECCRDRLYSTFAAGAHRRGRSQQCLDQGVVTVESVMGILRDHGGDDSWTPDTGLIGSQVCMHASLGPVRIGQTTGSLICELSNGRATAWITATSTPCTAIFKPVWLDAGLPDMGPPPGTHYDARALWWRHEAFMRAVQRDYRRRAPLFQADRDQLEKDFIERARAAQSAPADQRLALSQDCFTSAGEALCRWHREVSTRRSLRLPSLHTLAWKRFDRAARL